MRSPTTLIAFLFFSLTLQAQIEEKVHLDNHEIDIQFLEKVNSDFRDVNISITPNGRYLYFMSGRGGKPWTSNTPRYFKGRPEYDGDIWYSEIKDSVWQTPICMPGNVNTSRGEDEPNISPDAQRVCFQSWKAGWANTGGPYYQADLYGDKWENPVGLGGGINAYFVREMNKYNRYATDGMSISPNGRIFLVAAGPDYEGNLDIYISRKGANGQWSYLKPLDLNTPADERSVFIAGDNKTIYFGSSGYGGAGGLDIFKTTLNDDNSTGEIINIGAPFNTKEDDYGFIIGALGDDCFFVREDDIYYAHLSTASDKIKPSPTLVVNGIVKDSLGQPVQANIELYYENEQQAMATARSNSLTGEYSMSFPKRPGKYRQIFKKEDYEQESEFEIGEEDDNLLSLETELRKEPEPKPEPEPEVTAPLAYAEKSVEMLNEMVYFDFDKDDLKDSEQEKLNELLAQLKERASYKLSIIGHTDAIGSNAYNMALSLRRAQTVVDFFAKYNIEAEVKMDYRGEEVPAVENDTQENRALNRRVEIVVQ